MGRYYVCIGVESQSDSARTETSRRVGEKTDHAISKEDSATTSSSKNEGAPVTAPVTNSASDSSGTSLCSSSNQKDENDLLKTEEDQEGHFLQENVNRLLECSGLSNLRLAPSPSSGTSWLPKLPEPLRALSPSNLLLEEPAKRSDETVCDKAAKETAATDNLPHISLEEEATAEVESHQHDIEVEWEDPSLRDVYPFLRQGYSTEKKAWQNRSQQAELD